MKKIWLIFKLINLLQIRYDDYISFTFTKQRDGKEKWGIYTSIISHNYFYNKEDLISFIQNIIDYPILYSNHKRNTLIENLKYHNESIKDIKEELGRIDNAS